MFSILTIIYFNFLVILTRSQHLKLSVVNTLSGKVEGITETINGTQVHIFKGLPFAEPPVGKYRFQKPVEIKTKWTNSYDATEYKPACMQPIVDTITNTISEDCLYLNIWTKSLSKTANLPVMLWVHGGAFQVGSGAQLSIKHKNIYDGLQLALRNVVVVTFNYRLGVFGFLYGNSSETPGNAGLWDQAMALNWTRRNIASFGGNPNDITVFGESAGSTSVAYLIISNPALDIRNWFKKAILQSGTALRLAGTPDTASAYKVSQFFATNSIYWRNNQCPKHAWIECLRNKSSDDLNIAQTRTGQIIRNRFYGFLPFFPIYGEELIPLPPVKALKRGQFRTDLKLLIGHNEMEGAFTTIIVDIAKSLNGRYTPSVSYTPNISKDAVRNDIANIFFAKHQLANKIANAYTESLKNITADQLPIRRSAVYSVSDANFNCPTVLYGSYIKRWPFFTGKVYQYRLTYTNTHSISSGSVWANATHADELPLVFGRPFSELNDWSDSDRNLSTTVMDVWTYFVRNDGEVPVVNERYGKWPEYCKKCDGTVVASYLELHTDPTRLGRVFYDRYRGNDGYTPNVINNCFHFWNYFYQ